MKTPLTLLTVSFTISFLDGFFGWGLAEGFYLFSGFVIMGSIGWMWYILNHS